MGNFNTQLWGGGAGAPVGTATTARGLGYYVLRMLGVLRPGQTPSDDALNDILLELNQMLDSWATERLTIHAIARTPYALTVNVQDYTFGFGGNFDAARPVRIEQASRLPSGATRESELNRLAARWRMSQAEGFYDDGAQPLRNIWISFSPAAGDQIVFYTWVKIEAFADLDTEYSFPEGYLLAIRMNLADQIIPAFAALAKIDNVQRERITRDAIRSKANIKILNYPAPVLVMDSALVTPVATDILTLT